MSFRTWRTRERLPSFSIVLFGFDHPQRAHVAHSSRLEPFRTLLERKWKLSIFRCIFKIFKILMIFRKISSQGGTKDLLQKRPEMRCDVKFEFTTLLGWKKSICFRKNDFRHFWEISEVRLHLPAYCWFWYSHYIFAL